jgi:hypothetical protein
MNNTTTMQIELCGLFLNPFVIQELHITIGNVIEHWKDIRTERRAAIATQLLPLRPKSDHFSRANIGFECESSQKRMV